MANIGKISTEDREYISAPDTFWQRRSPADEAQSTEHIQLHVKESRRSSSIKKMGPLGRKRLACSRHRRRPASLSQDQQHRDEQQAEPNHGNNQERVSLSRSRRKASTNTKNYSPSLPKPMLNFGQPIGAQIGVETPVGTKVNRVDVLDDNGFSALHISAQCNQVETIHELIRRGADVNVKSFVDGATPLHMASRYNCPDAVEVLLQYGADVTDAMTNGQTPLHVCCRRGHLQVAKVLIHNGKADVNSRDKDKITPLHQACIKGDISVCTFLVENGANIRAMDINQVSPLMQAAQGGFKECVQYLLSLAHQFGIPLNDFLLDQDNESNTAIHLAVSNRHIGVARALIERGAPVNCKKTTNGFTPLHQAAIIGEEALANMLIDQGALTEITDNEQMTPLHRAALYNRVDVILLLIRQALYLDSKDDDNFTPLLCAAWKGQTDAGRALLRYGADIKALDKEMKSCLHWAIEMQHLEFTKMLFEHGHGGEEMIDWKDRWEQTALHYAAEVGNVEILNLLIGNGAGVVVKDGQERVPLHNACQFGHLQCVEALLQACPVPLNDDDIDDMTPLLLASQNGHHRVVKSLIRMGADIGSRNNDRRSALALAAKNNEMQVIKILIDNNANVNVVDRDLNTPLHLCAEAGHEKPTALLIDSGADLRLQNAKKEYPLDVAIKKTHEGVAKAMLSCNSWEVAMNNLDATGHTPMRRLIAVLPRAALKVMDQCVITSHDDVHHPDLKVTYNYNYIDPGPDDITFDKNKMRYFAMETMIDSGRTQLLAHKLTQTCLTTKWKRFARYFSYIDFFLYLTFVVTVSLFMRRNLQLAKILVDRDEYGCPFLNITNKTDEKIMQWLKTKSVFFEYQNVEDGAVYYAYVFDDTADGIALFLVVFIFIRVIYEIIDMLRHRLAYFRKVENYLNWMMFIPIFFFMIPVDGTCDWVWIWGPVIVFVTWMNFLFVLNRFNFFGLYMTMFFTTLKSLLKAMSVYIFFIIGFALAFFICFQSTNKAFRTEWQSFITTFVMTLGEINKSDLLDTEESIYPFEEIANVLLVIFLFLMPMVLVNLTIGISVGDIEQIHKYSYLKRLSLQVNIVLRTEKRFPRWLQRKAWLPGAEYWPNKHTSSVWRKIKVLLQYGSNSNSLQESRDDSGKEITVQDVMVEVIRHESTLAKLALMAHQQGKLLHRIAEKHDIKVELEDPFV